ncbi:FdhF/YdeP family oxidoreductase [Xylophilus rhododendri]|uniref:FdhF/YdeP family oxidoreductase n=1 Tax=Xylophilus rhododendri TaxID=2697032 RepID=A0A857J696_9BURK|nr:FdhF/YdeP family oxidoreductase [Xylophilus rhododendri]QHI99510.1 FdhF/YdeP family oxidoreductase [Xylophilus rhododendri]
MARRPQADAEFFARHRLAELEAWDDHALEAAGRLTTPLRWHADSDRYLPVSWDQAFAGIAAELQALRRDDARAAVFCCGGQASTEAAYLLQLLARLYGNNNLCSASELCQEASAVALPLSIGVEGGTVTRKDFAQTDAIFIFGQNVNAADTGFLHDLQEARKRGVPVVSFNPLRERGLLAFTAEQVPRDMLTPARTTVSTQYLQLRNGGDLAALTGLCKAVLALDDQAQAARLPRVLDTPFIARHTQGFEAFKAAMRASSWQTIEALSGLPRVELEQAAQVFARARNAICIYGSGLTQHRQGVRHVQMLVDLLLLGGHIGRPGAGIHPMHGHSNAQGQRSVGLRTAPGHTLRHRLARLYGFEPPHESGLNLLQTCEGMLDGGVRAFVGLGGNFLREVPDTPRVEAAWRQLRLTVQIATRLRRSHVLHGASAWLLPALDATEIDRQSGLEQALSSEDATGRVNASRGAASPASAELLSECAILARLAQATLEPNPRVPWQAWAQDYSRIRDAIAQTWPEDFQDFNGRLRTHGGFLRPRPARQRLWHTESGKACFLGQGPLEAEPATARDDDPVLRLMLLSSDEQSGSTVHGPDDRSRGIRGGRRVLLLHRSDIARLGMAEGQLVDASCAIDDGVERCVRGLRIVAYDIPPGSAAGYYPECNPLLPLARHGGPASVAAAKAIAIRLRAMPR